MTDPNILLSKCITLLYRESQLENATENSSDLVKTAIDKLKINEVSLGLPSKRDVSLGLKNLVMEMARNEVTHTYDPVELLQQVRIITNGDENLYKAIEQGIEPELQSPVLKRTITNIRKTISNFYREQRLAEIVRKASQDLNFGRHNISDLPAYIRNVILELEITSSKAVAKDPGIVGTMNFNDDESMNEIFSNVASANSEGLAFTTGWRELNEALQGGPRPGDTVVVGALQHNYKTGFSLSLFAHMAVYNKPKCKDPTKKPLLYRVSFEDPLRNNAQFLYQLLKYDETRQPVDVKGVTIEEMWKYVQGRMRATGYHVIMEEVNPNNWTYQSLINRVIELESEGYVVEVLQCDYLSKLPTTGCSHGSIGDDYMDLLSRVRAFCASQGIVFISPWQLSTEAKRLLATTPNDQFLSTIKGGGYFEKTRGLDRIYDIGILIHICNSSAGDFLHVVVDKHRFPSVVDASLKSWFMEMPSCKMPIPSNILDEEYRVFRKIPRGRVSMGDDFA